MGRRRRLRLAARSLVRNKDDCLAVVVRTDSKDRSRRGAEVEFPIYEEPVETVGIISNRGRRILGRIYDKGVESHWVDEGRALMGEWVRMEEQGRFGAQTRPGREHLCAEYLKSRFERRFVPLWRASKGLTVAGLPVLAEKIVSQVRAGEVSAMEAEKLAGFLVLENAGEAKRRLKRATYYRRKNELWELGLVLADEFYDPVEVHLEKVLERALETPLWGRG